MTGEVCVLDDNSLSGRGEETVVFVPVVSAYSGFDIVGDEISFCKELDESPSLALELRKRPFKLPWYILDAGDVIDATVSRIESALAIRECRFPRRLFRR